MFDTLDTTLYQKWISDNNMVNKAIKHCKLFISEYMSVDPIKFQEDLDISIHKTSDLKFEIYKLELSMLNEKKPDYPKSYFSVFISIFYHGEIKGYYKCVSDLSGNIFDDSLLTKDYF